MSQPVGALFHEYLESPDFVNYVDYGNPSIPLSAGLTGTGKDRELLTLVSCFI